MGAAITAVLERRCRKMNIVPLLDFLKKYWFLITAICAILVGIGVEKHKLDTISENMEIIEKSISAQSVSIGGEIDKVDQKINQRIDEIDERINKIQEQVYVLAGASPELVGLSISDSYKQSVNTCLATLDSFVLSNAAVQYTSIVAYNSKGNELTVEDVAQKKLLIPYKEEGKECFFYGQLDKYGNWDGECIINIYKDRKLILITEAVYDSGDLLSFKQAFPNETERQDGRDVWFFSRRTMKKNFSTGETWDYFRNSDYNQAFTYDSVTVEDILTIDDFQLKVGGKLEGYYNGNTSNGRFNDDSGEAYMVKYFEDGTVRTLYTGKFVDGFPEDFTNHAWMIGKNDTTSKYSYYIGPFEKGHPTINVNYNPNDDNSPWKANQDFIRSEAERFKVDKSVSVPLTGLILDDEAHITV